MTPTRLVDGEGEVEVGIFSAPITEINYHDFLLTGPFGRRKGRLARHFAFKQFQFLGLLSERLVFGCALADLRYVGKAFVYLFDPETRRLRQWSYTTPLALGFRFDQRPETGSASFRRARKAISMTGHDAPKERRLRVDLDRRISVEATFGEEEPPIQPMIICTRAGATGWVFARKTAGLPVRGRISLEGVSYDLEQVGALGHHDWSGGFMRRRTFWNWGCLAGRTARGRVIGMNVSCGVNETSFTENCFWVDGKLYKIDTVDFRYDRRDLTKPWRLSSYGGRLSLEFHPEGHHRERMNALILASNFTQLFGRYYGTLKTGAGEEIPVDGMLGYAESHYSKW